MMLISPCGSAAIARLRTFASRLTPLIAGLLKKSAPSSTRDSLTLFHHFAASAEVIQRGGESRHDRAGEGTARGGSVGRKDQQVVAPSRHTRFTPGHEGIFSKTLLFEK